MELFKYLGELGSVMFFFYALYKFWRAIGKPIYNKIKNALKLVIARLKAILASWKESERFGELYVVVEWLVMYMTKWTMIVMTIIVTMVLTGMILGILYLLGITSDEFMYTSGLILCFVIGIPLLWKVYKIRLLDNPPDNILGLLVQPRSNAQ
jgi:hypothetical protein